MNGRPGTPEWADGVYALFKTHGVDLVAFVPDSGHARLIDLCERDESIRTVTLTTEEEGVALIAGAFLGGRRGVLLMQSSGVGNCLNMLSLPRVCNVPFLTLVTMRGEWGEFNPWQVPMGQSTPAVLEASGVIVYRADTIEDVAPTVAGALALALQSRRLVAVLLSQRLIGAKTFADAEQ